MDHPKKIRIENIEQDMWNKAQEIWGVKRGTSPEAFDPLVKMLIGAQAVEIKKIREEIESSKSRILQKLAQLMMPEILTGPIPASTILHLQPYDPIHTITPDLQATFNKEEVEAHFSPAGNYDIIDAKIECCYLLLSNSLIDITERTSPNQVAAKPEIHDLKNREQIQVSSTRTLLIGLDISDAISFIDNLSFYFDWINIPGNENEEYCRLLQSTHWSLNGEPIQIRSGVVRKPISEESAELNEFERKYDIAAIHEDRINDFYKDHFVTVHLGKNIEDQKICQPESITNLVQDQKLYFPKPLLWFEVHFPANYSDEKLKDNLTLQVNCVPAMNRRLHTARYMLYGNEVNVFPLKTDEQFLTIKDVRDSHGKQYRNIPNFMSKDSQAGFYYLRHGGVDRVDSRQASELLRNLIELMQDESASFSALNPDELMTDLKDLNQIVSRLEKKVNLFDQNKHSIWYLIINPYEHESMTNDEITVQYWTTLGDNGNDIPIGEINRTTSNHHGPAISEVSNIVTSGHGRNSLKEEELLSAYRNALLTRNRIVTPEDIKSICRVYLGSQISNVEIKKGIIINTAPKQGLNRSIDVILTPAKTSKLDKKEWEKMCTEVQVILENQWMGGCPLRVKIRDN